MIRLGLSDESEAAEAKIPFWERQFEAESTKKQRIFDWIFGVIMPVICFAFDPLLFRGYLLGEPLIGRYKPAAYILSFTLVMGLSASLIWGKKLGWINSLLAGLFTIGSIGSLAIGIFLLPFSIFGLLAIIGLLGFTPLFSFFAYLRNARLAYRAAGSGLRQHALIASFFLGAILSTAIPVLVNVKINAAIQGMRNGNADEIRRNAQKLKYIAPLADFTGLLREAKDSDYDKERRKALLEACVLLRGNDERPKRAFELD